MLGGYFSLHLKKNVSVASKIFTLTGKHFRIYCLLYLKNARLLILRAIPDLSCVLFYENGDVLRSFTFALLKYEISFIMMQSSYSFDSLLCDLFSALPNICSDTKNISSDLRDMFINLVCKSFREGWNTEICSLHHPNIIRLLRSIYNPNPCTYDFVLNFVKHEIFLWL